MSFAEGLRSVLELVLVGVTLWALFHEDRFVALEEGLLTRWRRRRLHVLSSNRVQSTAHPMVTK